MGKRIRKVARDAATGEFVTAEYAAGHPVTTVTETVPVVSPGEADAGDGGHPGGAAAAG